MFAFVACSKDESFAKIFASNSRKKHAAHVSNVSSIDLLKTFAELQEAAKTLTQNAQSDKATKIAQVAKIADMYDCYKTHYSELCLYGHPNLSGLVETLRFSEKGRPSHHILERSDNQVEDSFHTAMCFMLEIVRNYRSFFNLDFHAEMIRVGEIFKGVNTAYTKLQRRLANEYQKGQ